MTELVGSDVFNVTTLARFLASARPREERETNVGEHDVGVDDGSVERPHVGAGNLTGVRVGPEHRHVAAVVAKAGVVDPAAIAVAEWALGRIAPGIQRGLERLLGVVGTHGTVLRIQIERDRRRRPFAERAVHA